MEDGMLDPARFLWTLSGSATRGERFALNDVTPGAYAATLGVTDSAGQSASNSVHFEVLPLSVPDRPSPIIDGLRADAAYVNALQVSFSSGGQQSYARMSHADGFLHVAFTDLPFSSSPSAPLSVGLVIDTTGSRPSTPGTSDVGFYVDETSRPSQWKGSGNALVLNSQPALGVQTAIVRSGNAWSAELKIPESLLGGWSHAAGLLIHVRDESGATSFTWPTAAATANPSSWAPALFGLSAPASNRPPVAVVHAPRVLSLASGQRVTLDGRQSYDPDGQAITYHWTQLSGPTVALLNPNAPVAAFTFSPSNSVTTLRFRLVVNDGSLDSSPADSDLTIYSVALNPQPFPPIWSEGSSGPVHASLTWPGVIGDRAVIEASQDLKVWVPIRTNTVDFDGLLHFRDPAAGLYPWRFYRARGLFSSDTVVYSQDFEHAIGSEWSPAHSIATTPIGGRHFLGQFGAEAVSLSLGALPQHTRIKVSCDLFIIGLWDGNFPEGGPDEWQLQVRGGATLLDATFSTYYNQSYPGVLGDSFPPRTNAAENDTLGYTMPGFGGGDSVYHLTFTFDHSDSNLVLGFNGLGLHTFGDETWGLDNVAVEAINNP